MTWHDGDEDAPRRTWTVGPGGTTVDDPAGAGEVPPGVTPEVPPSSGFPDDGPAKIEDDAAHVAAPVDAATPAGAGHQVPPGDRSGPSIVAVGSPASAGLGRRTLVTAVVVSALVSGLVSGGITAANRGDDGPAPPAATPLRTVEGPRADAAGTNSIQDVLRRVEPAVVSIRTQSYRPGGVAPQGAGTGMILTPDGEVLTNAHVVDGATAIRVTLFGETEARAADLVGSDPGNDLAIVKIREAKDLPTVELGDSEAIEVGDDVVAIGNALALAGGPSVTTGIVSAKNRSLEDESISLQGLIQTDAAINPGNSGGPLVNSAGQVIGINTAVIQGGGGGTLAQNVGFAIAVNRAKPILERIRSGDASVGSQAYIGVTLETLTSEIRDRFGFTPERGVIVSELVPGGPAEMAGVRSGDVVVAVGTRAVRTAEELVEIVQARQPGERIELRVFRGEQERTFTVTLGSRGVANR